MIKLLKIEDQIVGWLRSVTMKLANCCPFGKIWIALLSFLVFTIVFTFWVAIILFSGLLIHEIGHAWAANLKKRGIMGIYIFPWFNGLCAYKNKPSCPETDIFCALMGPIFSIAFALLLGVFSFFNKEPLFTFCSFAIALMSLRTLITRKFREYQFSSHDGTKIVGILFSGKIKRINFMLFSIAYVALIVIGLGIIFFTFSNTFNFLSNPEHFFQPFFCDGISFWINLLK